MLSIGDFARYAGVSVRMLRHYDAIGLLTPARVDAASGYRFYDADQLARANALVALKELGYAGADEGMDIGVGFEGDPVPGTEAGRLDAVPRAVTAVYRGDMAHIGEAWQALAAHVQQAGLGFTGPCREVYLQTEGPQGTWVTELQQPV